MSGRSRLSMCARVRRRLGSGPASAVANATQNGAVGARRASEYAFAILIPGKSREVSGDARARMAMRGKIGTLCQTPSMHACVVEQNSETEARSFARIAS